MLCCLLFIVKRCLHYPIIFFVVLTAMKVGLPSLDLGGSEQEGNLIIIKSPDYPAWTVANDFQCRIEIPPYNLVRLDLMDLSHNGSIQNYTYCLTLGSDEEKCVERGTPPSTLIWNNSSPYNTSIFMNMTIRDGENYMNLYVRSFLYLLGKNYPTTTKELSYHTLYSSHLVI